MRSEKGLKRAVSLLAVALFYTLIVGNSAAQVAGGKHDLSFGGNSNFQYFIDEVCVFCHTPHASNINQTYTTNPTIIGSSGTLNGQFLWNRATPEGRTWSVYTSDTMNHNTLSGPGKLSLLCLSCHDGVGAMNVLLNTLPSGQPSPMPGVTKNQFGDFALTDPNMGLLNIGEAVCTGDSCTDGDKLQNDHPIGFQYLGSAADPKLRDLNSILNLQIRDRMQNVTNGRMECSSCHDPHRTNVGGNMFLVVDNISSQLCLACHNK